MHSTKDNRRYPGEYDQLWDALVPPSGQANTVQGELVRVIGRLGSEYNRNGNGNWDRGFRMFTNFLAKHLPDQAVFDSTAIIEIEQDIRYIRALGSGRRSVLPEITYEKGVDPFDRLADRVVEWCQYYSEPIERELNPKLKR